MKKELAICVYLTLFHLGCQDTLHNYAECKKIESARCELRKNCQTSGDKSFNAAFKDFDYESCLTYAREHCRTRKISWSDSEWNSDDIAACTSAILALHPAHCKDLSKADDETEWSILNDACIFIEEREEPVPSDTENDGGTTNLGERPTGLLPDRSR